MNIYLSDKSCDLLKDENALRQKVAKFLAEPEQTQNVYGNDKFIIIRS